MVFSTKFRAAGAALALLVAACGPGADSGTTTDTVDPGQTVYVPDPVAESPAAFRSLSHDGGASELDLGWTQESAEVALCPGEHTLSFSIENNSAHTAGENLWFTILYYRGEEYVTGHHIEPMGISVPVGATQQVNYTIGIRPEFASAGDRDIYVALIVQTDNPNLGDPDAFFRRLWLRVVPGDCNGGTAEQPPREPLHIYSVTCPGNTVRLQVGERLIQGTPSASIVHGDQYVDISRQAYYDSFGGSNFWWADLFVTAPIPANDQFIVAFGSNASDTMYFHFSPRVSCGGTGGVSTGDTDVVTPPGGNGGSGDDGGGTDDGTDGDAGGDDGSDDGADDGTDDGSDDGISGGTDGGSKDDDAANGGDGTSGGTDDGVSGDTGDQPQAPPGNGENVDKEDTPFDE